MQYTITKFEEAENPKRTTATVRFTPTGISKLFSKEKEYVFNNIKGDWVTESGKVAFGKLKNMLADELSSTILLREIQLEQTSAT